MKAFIMLLCAFVKPQAVLVVENALLRHQLAVLQRSVKRPKFQRLDRVLWIMVSRLWNGWRQSLVIVQPATVVRWHREGFRLFWQ